MAWQWGAHYRFRPREVHAVTARVVTLAILGHKSVRRLTCRGRWKWRWLRPRSLGSCRGTVDRSSACHCHVLYHGRFGVLFGTTSLTSTLCLGPCFSEAADLFLVQCCADNLQFRVAHLEEELLHPRGVHIPVGVKELANKHRDEGRGRGCKEWGMPK